MSIYPSVKLINFGYLLFELVHQGMSILPLYSFVEAEHIRHAWDLIKNNDQLDPLAKQTIGKRYLEYLDETSANVAEYNNAEWWVSSKRHNQEGAKKRKAEDHAKADKKVKENGMHH